MQSEDGESGQVGGCGEEVEVGVDFGGAAHSCSSAAVAAAHQVSEFAFHFWAGGPVVAPPDRFLLAGHGTFAYNLAIKISSLVN